MRDQLKATNLTTYEVIEGKRNHPEITFAELPDMPLWDEVVKKIEELVGYVNPKMAEAGLGKMTIERNDTLRQVHIKVTN